jgi:TnpA family transposase
MELQKEAPAIPSIGDTPPPRYTSDAGRLHYDRAVSVYSHLSDRLGVYGTQVISCAPREATYVLTSILDNDTSIDPEMHTTDTHGFTESLWGLCYLLGIRLGARIDRRL